MSDQKNNPPEKIGSIGKYIDKTDEKYLEFTPKMLEELKTLPERREEKLWDKI